MYQNLPDIELKNHCNNQYHYNDLRYTVARHIMSGTSAFIFLLLFHIIYFIFCRKSRPFYRITRRKIVQLWWVQLLLPLLNFISDLRFHFLNLNLMLVALPIVPLGGLLPHTFLFRPVFIFTFICPHKPNPVPLYRKTS